jgi:hypothetical protein
MKRLALLFTIALAACGGSEAEVKLEPASAALTDKGEDALFTLEFEGAPEKGYEAVTVKALIDGKATDLTCNLSDANSNKVVDKGDKLSCVEGKENAFDSKLAGKSIHVELYAKVDGKETRIADAVWTPR